MSINIDSFKNDLKTFWKSTSNHAVSIVEQFRERINNPTRIPEATLQARSITHLEKDSTSLPAHFTPKAKKKAPVEKAKLKGWTVTGRCNTSDLEPATTSKSDLEPATTSKIDPIERGISPVSLDKEVEESPEKIIASTEGFEVWVFKEEDPAETPNISNRAPDSHPVEIVARFLAPIKGTISFKRPWLDLILMIISCFSYKPQLRLFIEESEGRALKDAYLNRNYSVRAVEEQPKTGIGSEWLPIIIKTTSVERKEVWIHADSLEKHYGPALGSDKQLMNDMKNPRRSAEERTERLAFRIMISGLLTS